MTGPFQLLPEQYDPDGSRETTPQRLRSLLRGHAQIHSGRWVPTVIYLGMTEWTTFAEEAFSDEWTEQAPLMRLWTYAEGRSVVLRLIEESAYCKVFGDLLPL